MNQPLTTLINKRLLHCGVTLCLFAGVCLGADSKPHTVCIDHDALPPMLLERIVSLLQSTEFSVAQLNEKDGEPNVARIDIVRNRNYYDIEIAISGHKVAEAVGVSGRRLPYLLLDRLRANPSRIHVKSHASNDNLIRLRVVCKGLSLGLCNVLDAASGISIGKTNSEGVVVIAARQQLPYRVEIRTPNSSFLAELSDSLDEQTIDVGTLPNPSEASARIMSAGFLGRMQFENNVIISKINRESQRSVQDGTPGGLAVLRELGETLANTQDLGRQEWSVLQDDFENLDLLGRFANSDSPPLPSTKGWPNIPAIQKRMEYNMARLRIEAMRQRRDFEGIVREYNHFRRLARAADVHDEGIDNLGTRVRAYRDTSLARRKVVQISNAEYRVFVSRLDELKLSVKTILDAGDKWGANEAIKESVVAIKTIKSEMNRVNVNSAVGAENDLKLFEKQLKQIAKCVELLKRLSE